MGLTTASNIRLLGLWRSLVWCCGIIAYVVGQTTTFDDYYEYEGIYMPVDSDSAFYIWRIVCCFSLTLSHRSMDNNMSPAFHLHHHAWFRDLLQVERNRLRFCNGLHRWRGSERSFHQLHLVCPSRWFRKQHGVVGNLSR